MSPAEKKRLFYERDTYSWSGVNNVHSSRKSFPLLKARLARRYRHDTRRLLITSGGSASEFPEIGRTPPIRREYARNWGKPAVSMGVRVQQQLRARAEQTR